jgi:hypothetical protein
VSGKECFFGHKEAQKAVCPLLLTGMLRRALAAASQLVDGEPSVCRLGELMQGRGMMAIRYLYANSLAVHTFFMWQVYGEVDVEVDVSSA